jgi:hypothetical protein
LRGWPTGSTSESPHRATNGTQAVCRNRLPHHILEFSRGSKPVSFLPVRASARSEASKQIERARAIRAFEIIKESATSDLAAVAQRRNGLEQPPPIAFRSNAEILQVLGSQLGKQVGIDLVFTEPRLLLEATLGLLLTPFQQSLTVRTPAIPTLVLH